MTRNHPSIQLSRRGTARAIQVMALGCVFMLFARATDLAHVHSDGTLLSVNCSFCLHAGSDGPLAAPPCHQPCPPVVTAIPLGEPQWLGHDAHLTPLPRAPPYSR